MPFLLWPERPISHSSGRVAWVTQAAYTNTAAFAGFSGTSIICTSVGNGTIELELKRIGFL